MSHAFIPGKTNWGEVCFPDGVANEDNDFRRADSQGPEEVAQGSGEEEAQQGVAR